MDAPKPTMTNECPSCDYVSEDRFSICPICSSEFADRSSCGKLPGSCRDGEVDMDFQNGFRFAMRLMERTGHRLDTKELFDTLADVAVGEVKFPHADNHAAEANRAFALRMLQILDGESKSREALIRPKMVLNQVNAKVAAYS